MALRLLAVVENRAIEVMACRLRLLGGLSRRMRVCVFGSSSSVTPQAYIDAARDLGILLADGGHVCINGGGSGGVMGALNEVCTARGGRVIGCIHTMWVIEGLQFELSELRVAEGPDLHLRKKMLYEEAECFITLPGGKDLRRFPTWSNGP